MTLRIAGCLLFLATCAPLAAQDTDPESPIAVHGQTTWIRQFKPSFQAAYTGPASLQTQREFSYSFTATADIGVRLWRGAQLHLNPEAAEGLPLSRLTGAGGLSNGELQRGAGTTIRSYRARMFIQQRIDMGGAAERVEADFNELGGATTERRWTLTAGLFSLLDFVDPNPYAKDPRQQFTNWSFLAPAGWDYPADARGYTIGAIADYRTPTWAVRFGRAAQPIQSNGANLEHRLSRQYGDFAEGESDLPVRLPGGPLRARLLLFHNHVVGARFDDAIAAAGGGVPDLAPVRRPNDKRGWAVTLQAPLGEDQGLFVRASRSDGRVETYAFAEIDQQLAVGAQFTGRGRDRWGVAYARNGISASHQRYFALGGQTIFVGDGALRAGPEHVAEAYYRWVLPDLAAGSVKLRSALSAGVQQLVHPAYNRDRGPVQVWMTRFHADF